MKSLKKIRLVSKVISIILEKIEKKIAIGLSGKDLEKIALDLMNEYKVKSSSYKYYGFPGYICVSVNSELTHGVPNEEKFKNGDIVSVDVACNYHGFHADAARTFLVFDKENFKKEDFAEKLELITVTKDSLDNAIKSIIPGKTTNKDLGLTIWNYVREKGFFTIKEYGGHGIGKNLHQEPFIPNYPIDWIEECIIQPEMIICIEPLVQFNDDEVVLKEDKFTIVSKNKRLNAHFEHTIFIGVNEVEILV